MVEFQEDPLVKPIYKDSIEKVEEIRSILWKAQNSFKATSILTQVQPLQHQAGSVNSVELREVTLKLALIMADKEAMLRNYLRIMKTRFTGMITDIANSAKHPTSNKHGSSKDLTFGARQEEFLATKKYRISLEDFSAFYRELESEVVSAEIREEGSVIWLVNEFVCKAFAELEVELDFLFTKLPIKTDSFAQKDEVIETTVKEITIGIIEEVKKKMAKKVTNIEVSECLKELSTCLKRVILSNESLKRMLKTTISDKFSELAEKVCRGQVMHCFSHLRQEYFKLIVRCKRLCNDAHDKCLLKPMTSSATAKEVSEIESTTGKELDRIVGDFSSRFDCLVQWTCLELRSLLFSEVQFLRTDEMFLRLVNQSMIDFVRYAMRLLGLRAHSITQELIGSFEQASSQSIKEIMAVYAEAVVNFQTIPESSVWFILAASALKQFEEKGIAKVFEILNETNRVQLQTLCAQQPALQEFTAHEAQSIETQEIPMLRGICRRDAAMNYVNYSQMATEVILSSVAAYFLEVQSSSSVGGSVEKSDDSVSKLVIAAGERIRQTVVELNVLFPDSRRQLATKGSFVKEDTAGMMMDMERLIVKKSRAFELDKLDFNRGSLLLSIARASVKTVIEKVRRVRYFTDAAFKQMQVDMFFLVQVLYDIVSVDEESYIVASFYEMIESARDSVQSTLAIDPTDLFKKANAQRVALKW